LNFDGQVFGMVGESFSEVPALHSIQQVVFDGFGTDSALNKYPLEDNWDIR
jgi:hypothetical protein